MAKQKRSTLESIARQLGVSKMTVSNAYNRPDQLSPELRERILLAVGPPMLAGLWYIGPLILWLIANSFDPIPLQY